MELFRNSAAEENAEAEAKSPSPFKGLSSWLGSKLSKGKEAVIQKSREGMACLDSTANALLDEMKFTNEMRKKGLRTPAMCSMIVVGAVLTTKVAGPLVIPGMPHPSIDDLTALAGSIDLNHLQDSLMQAINNLDMGVLAAQGPAAPVESIPVAPPPVDNGPHPIEIPLDDGTGGDDNHTLPHPTYTYEKATEVDPFGRKTDLNFDQNPFQPEKSSGTPDRYEEIIKSMHKGDGFAASQFDPNKISESGIGSGSTPVEQNIEAGQGGQGSAVNEVLNNGGAGKTASNLEGQINSGRTGESAASNADIVKAAVESQSTGESEVNNARTIGSQVGSEIPSTSGSAVEVKDGVANIGGKDVGGAKKNAGNIAGSINF